MNPETKQKLKNRLETAKFMLILLVAAPLPVIFGLKKSYGSTVKQECKEYAECWQNLCIMFYFGEQMTRETLIDTMQDREGEHI